MVNSHIGQREVVDCSGNKKAYTKGKKAIATTAASNVAMVSSVKRRVEVRIPYNQFSQICKIYYQAPTCLHFPGVNILEVVFVIK